MRTQAREQGRYLGGRPPYGYRLVERWSASQSCARGLGASAAPAGLRSGDGAARTVDVPTAVGRAECGQHRAGADRAGCAVAPRMSIPIATGHRAGGCLAVADGRGDLSQSALHRAPGMRPTVHGHANSDRLSHRSAPAGDWVISASAAHPALVSEAHFVAAQQVRAARPTGDGERRCYLLSGWSADLSHRPRWVERRALAARQRSGPRSPARDGQPTPR